MSPLNYVLWRLLYKLTNEMLAIAVGVRVTGSDVDTVILKLKGGCETKSKVVQLFLVRHVGNV